MDLLLPLFGLSDGKSLTSRIKKNLAFTLSFENGLVLICDASHGNLICTLAGTELGHMAPESAGMCVKCVCQPQSKQKSILILPFCSLCPCVFVIFNNMLSIQQLIQLTRIEIINEHAHSPFEERLLAR